MPDTHEWTKHDIEGLISDLIGIRNQMVENRQRSEAEKLSQAIVLLDILAERRKTA